jgi:hypothetical protein
MIRMCTILILQVKIKEEVRDDIAPLRQEVDKLRRQNEWEKMAPK